MSDSANAYAFAGCSTTQSSGASAYPVVSAVRADPSISSKGLLLACWDFSQMPSTTFAADGNVVVKPTSGQSSTATWRFADMAAGLGATGKIRINSGKLEMKGCVDAGVANSIWGLNTGRASRSANFAINLRSLSATLSQDPRLTSHRYRLEVELDPSFSGGNPANITVPTYHQLHYGFATEMDPVVAGTATQGRFMNMAYHVSTGSTSSTHTWNTWSRRGYNVATGEGGSNPFQSAYTCAKFSDITKAGGNGYKAAWEVTTPQKVVIQHDGIRENQIFYPSATSDKIIENNPNLEFHLQRSVNTDTSTAPFFNQGSTNDVWAFFTVFRGWAAAGSTTGEYKIKKISIFEVRL